MTAVTARVEPGWLGGCLGPDVLWERQLLDFKQDAPSYMRVNIRSSFQASPGC